MKTSGHAFRHAGLVAILALQGSALGLVSQEAQAAWHCALVDGNGSSNTGHTSYDVNGATSAVLFGTLAVPLYTRLDSSGQTWIKDGFDTNFGTMTCNGTDPFSLGDVTGPATNSPGAIQDGATTWIAYTDTGGNLWAGGSSGGPIAGTKIWTNGGNYPYMVGTPSLAVYGGNIWVFYTAYYNNRNEVHYKFYNGSVWSSDIYLDGVAGDNRESPTAVVFNGDLWVFYWESTSGYLVGQYWDGTSWNVSQAGNGSGYLDGNGTNANGQNGGYTGKYPSAIVDTTVSPERMYVFYYDYAGVDANHLRVSHLDVGGSWYAQDVEGVSIDNPVAPVINGGVQIFYGDSVNHTLRQAYPSGSSWVAQVIDGGSSNACASRGGTSDSLGGPVAAVVRTECNNSSLTSPHVFYGDLNASGHKTLREAFWY